MTSKRPKGDISTDNGIPADPPHGQSDDAMEQAVVDDAGIEKVLRHAGRRPKERHGGASRKPLLQGRKTHERQLRILQRKSDGLDE
jgi:hypothetical protein